MLPKSSTCLTYFFYHDSDNNNSSNYYANYYHYYDYCGTATIGFTTEYIESLGKLGEQNNSINYFKVKRKEPVRILVVQFQV